MKVIIVGDTNTGKTSWVRKITGFDGIKERPTMGADVYKHKHGKRTLELWDTAGNEKYGGLHSAYYVGATCAIIFYTDRAQVEKYKQEILTFVGKKIPFVAVNFAELQDPEEPFQRLFK